MNYGQVKNNLVDIMMRLKSDGVINRQVR